MRKKLSFVFSSIVLLCNCAGTKSITNTSYAVEYIHSGKIFESYEAKKDAQNIFNAITKKAEDKAFKLKNTNAAEYSQFLTEIFGKDGKVIKLNEKLTKIVIDTLNSYLEIYCKYKKLDFLLDTRDTIIIYADDKYNLEKKSSSEIKRLIFQYGINNFSNYTDITDNVINELNQKYVSNRYMNSYEHLIDETTF